MLHAMRRWTPPLSAALATAFLPPLSPRLVDAAVSRCPSDALALSFFLWCARRPAYFHPPASFDRILPTATRLASRFRTAPAILRELRTLGCPIRPHTFLLLLRLYWRGGLYPLVLQLFDQMPLWGFHPNVFARNVALDVHLRIGRLDAALRFLRDNPSPNYLTYAIVVTHLCRAGHWSGARDCFMAMLQQGFLPSVASLTSVFACCSKTGTMFELLQLLSFTLVSGYQLTTAMWTCFIARMCRERRLDEACKMLAKMLDSGSSPTVVTYTPLVKGLFRAGRHDKVSELLGSMASTGCSPDLVFYNVIMDCMMKERRYHDALDVYLNLHGSQIKPDAYTLSTLVQVLQLSQNRGLLPRSILGTDISYDLVACNSVLSALCKSGFPSEAIQVFFDMIDLGIRPDSYSYVGFLDSLFQLGKIDLAKNAYSSIVADDPDSNAYVHAAILRGLVRRGQNHMALSIFREAVCQNYALDAVCYTIVLHGLFQAHLVEEACELFDKMKCSGMASNTCIYNVMLRGLCRTRDMHAVTQLLREMECANVQMDSNSFNIVVVLLIKLQRISSATALVREMLNLGMKLSTKTCWLLSQSIGHAFIMEDNTIAESDGFETRAPNVLATPFDIKRLDIPVKRKIEKKRDKVLYHESVLKRNPYVQPVPSSLVTKDKKKAKKKKLQEAQEERIVSMEDDLAEKNLDIWGGDAKGDAKAKKRSTTSVIPAVEVEPPGCSFNPPFEAHQDSLALAVTDEMRKIFMKELGPKPVPLTVPGEAITEEDKFFLDADDGDEDAAEGDGDQDADTLAGQRKAKTKIVTRVELNRRARRKERLRAEVEAKKIENLSKEIDSLPNIIDEIAKEDEEKEKRLIRRTVAKQERLKSAPPRLGRHKFEPGPVQVLLTEEISGSLRKLKGCCNLARDRYKSIEKRGLLAPSKRIRKRR